MADIHTPAWVKDAVFYQIFPERNAGEAQQPGAVGYAADHLRV